VDSAVILARELRTDDYSQWLRLARAYKAFYKTPTSDDEFDIAWRRVLSAREVFGLGAFVDDELVAFTHYLYHASTWADGVCYLQDLYTDENSRGRGLARALIEAVAVRAKQRGAARLYWLTHSDNTTARALYDTLAAHHGFIRYDYPMN
jgi:ribosomal protein S18 acetylase RimI-like enzyme